MKTVFKMTTLALSIAAHCIPTQGMHKTPSLLDLKTAYEVKALTTQDPLLPIQLANQITYDNFRQVPHEVMKALAKTNHCFLRYDQNTKENKLILEPDPVNGHPDVTRSITNTIVPRVINDNKDWDLFNELSRLDVRNIHRDISAIVKNFLEQCTTHISSNTARAKAKQIVANITKHSLKAHDSWELLYDLANINNSFLNTELEICIKKYYPNIESMVKQLQEYTPLEVALFCGHKANPLFIYAKIKKITWKNDLQTQSHQQFYININRLNQQRLIQQFSPHLRSMFLDGLKHEAIEKEKGSFCFWRAETMNKLLQALMAKSLYVSTSGKKCPYNYYPLRSGAVITTTNANNGGLCSNEERVFLLKNNPKTWYEPRLVYMNYALFANTNEWGSSTPKLLDLNMNWIPDRENILQQLFTTFNCEDTYKKYVDRITEIELEAKNSIAGFLLMFSLKKSQINNYIYSASVGGSHRKVKIGGVYKNNVVDIVTALTEKPESIQDDSDHLEFCAIFGEAFGPESKDPINIQWFIDDSMKPWLKKLTTLLTDIEKDISEHMALRAKL